MNIKGFTLIELLAVITILSLIALVTSISVANMLKDSKDELSSTQMKSIKSAAEAWGADNIADLPTGNSCSYITLSDLKDEGILDSNIMDPKDKTIISNDLKVKITSKLNGKGKSVLTYEVNPENVNNCTYIGSPLYVDVPEGLTPVIYVDESTTENPTKGYWKVPELNEEWYNYDSQMWANAVVLGKGKTKKPGEKVTVEGENPDALMMLVYVPRYEYRIIGEYGTHSNGEPGTADLPGEIEIKFINNSQIKADDDYILHPAFDFGGEQLSGIWVGKFELSHTTKSQVIEDTPENYTASNLNCIADTCTESKYLRILPNVLSLRYNNVSSFFFGIKGIENSFNLNSIDSHMIKNSEWGAVAYLSQSKYGKYGNTDYQNKYKEIYVNGWDSSNLFMTGKSGGDVSGFSLDSVCSYNDMTNLGLDSNNYKKGQCGPGASTTGNIYGVYDMSGGSREYVMGVYGDAEGIYSGLSASNNSGFRGKLHNGEIKEGTTLPYSKYYDKYEAKEGVDFTVETACKGEICYGHALSETNKWHNAFHTMISSSNSWFVRGGTYFTTDSDVFAYEASTGKSDATLSTRVVFISR